MPFFCYYSIMKNKFRNEITGNLTTLSIYLMISLAALLYSFGINAFFQTANIFSTGIGSVAGLITYSTKELLPYFSLLYLALNIPLILIFWKKIKKAFILRTSFFLIMQALFGLIFIVPEVSDGLANILGSQVDIQKDVWPILVLPLAGAIFVGVSMALSYKAGASTGGTDIVVYYYSTKKKISIGKLAFIASLILITFSFSTTLALGKTNLDNWYITLLSTIAAALIASIMVDRLYPKYSKRKLEIHTSKQKEVEKFLKSSNHAYFTNEVVSGYTNKRKNVIYTTVLLLEVKKYRKELFAIDKQIWISDSRVDRVFGNFNSSSVE